MRYGWRLWVGAMGGITVIEYASFHFYYQTLLRPPKLRGFEVGPVPGVRPFDNLLGQHEPLPLWFGVGLLVGIYFARYWIRRRAANRVEAVWAYMVLIVAAVPYLWLLVANDWNTIFAFDVACWVGTPIALLFVPTAMFLAEITWNWPASIQRSMFELIILCPVWLGVWTFAEHCLGFYWF